MGTSLGACSVSSRIQSKPESARISTTRWLDRLCHSPICNRPDFSACLKGLMSLSIALAPKCLMDFWIGRRRAALEEIEVAAPVRLAHMIREQAAVAAGVARRGLSPGGA